LHNPICKVPRLDLEAGKETLMVRPCPTGQSGSLPFMFRANESLGTFLLSAEGVVRGQHIGVEPNLC
jgi:hypothetical protein